MNRSFASFFLFIYLFANTELHELVKIGAFVTHFAEHKRENKDMTLLAFIQLHYFSGNTVDADYAQDMKLPFKATDCNNANASHTINLPDFFLQSPVVALETVKLPLYDPSALPSSHLSDIWQPPKSC